MLCKINKQKEFKKQIKTSQDKNIWFAAGNCWIKPTEAKTRWDIF